MTNKTNNISRTKKYIKHGRDEITFKTIGIVFLIILYIMPQYFGFQIAGFDMTSQRVMLVILLIYIFSCPKRASEFIDIVRYSCYFPAILAFLLVTIYTMVLRVDINSFLQYLLEFLCLYLMLYVIKDSIGIKKAVNIFVILIAVLCVLGLIEYVKGGSLFHYLATMKGKYVTQIRSGEYRIMGPCNHALAYGLMLEISLPLICIDVDNNEIDIFKHKILYLLLLLNVFLTGSRSTLMIFILESVCLFFLGNRETKKRNIIIIAVSIACLIIFLAVCNGSSLANTIMRQIASVIDTIFGTQYAANYGAEMSRLDDSKEYRKALKYVFTVKYLSPILGRGVTKGFSGVVNGITLISIDNFYIATYIRYAYPGMIAYISIIITSIVNMYRFVRRTKSKIAMALLIGVVGYYWNLYWMDTLQTLKYVYILLALFGVMYDKDKYKEQIYEETNTVVSSKYIKDKRRSQNG